jgi:hypothetical protein
MVNLVNPEPPSPKAGGKFSITADLGIPPYTFTWRINEHDSDTKTQNEKVLTIDIPRDAGGDILFVKVVDAEDAQDAATFIIEGDKPNDL